jgi:hypothetical protein
MPLQHQWVTGEIADWATRHFIGTDRAVTVVAEAVAGHPPVRSLGRTDGQHQAEIAAALRLRLTAVVEPAPPYEAIAGVVWAGFVTVDWAGEQVAQWPTHAWMPAADRWRAGQMRPSPTGWVELGYPPPNRREESPEKAHGEVLDDFFARLRRYLREHAPPGQLGSAGAETALARVYWMVGALEDLSRGIASKTLYRLFAHRVPSVESMRAAAPDAAVAELVALTTIFQERGGLAAWRRLAGHPPAGQFLGHAAPTMVHPWARGDVLLHDPRTATSTVLDIRTMARVDHPARTARWLWSLLAYAWLDDADRWRIRRAGLYLARHGVVITWTILELATLLLSDARERRHEQLRQEFLQLARRAAETENATWPT